MCWLFCRLVGSALANAQRSLAAGHALVQPDFTCPRSVTWNALLRRAGGVLLRKGAGSANQSSPGREHSSKNGPDDALHTSLLALSPTVCASYALLTRTQTPILPLCNT